MYKRASCGLLCVFLLVHAPVAQALPLGPFLTKTAIAICKISGGVAQLLLSADVIERGQEPFETDGKLEKEGNALMLLGVTTMGIEAMSLSSTLLWAALELSEREAHEGFRKPAQALGILSFAVTSASLGVAAASLSSPSAAWLIGIAAASTLATLIDLTVVMRLMRFSSYSSIASHV